MSMNQASLLFLTLFIFTSFQNLSASENPCDSLIQSNQIQVKDVIAICKNASGQWGPILGDFHKEVIGANLCVAHSGKESVKVAGVITLNEFWRMPGCTVGDIGWWSANCYFKKDMKVDYIFGQNKDAADYKSYFENDLKISAESTVYEKEQHLDWLGGLYSYYTERPLRVKFLYQRNSGQLRFEYRDLTVVADCVNH